HLAPPGSTGGRRPLCRPRLNGGGWREVWFRRRPLCEVFAHAAERSQLGAAAFAPGKMLFERCAHIGIDVVVQVRDQRFFPIVLQMTMYLSHGLKFSRRVLSARPIVWRARAAEP